MPAVCIRLLVTVMALLTFPSLAENQKPLRWTVYYTDVLPGERFKPYDIIVFDNDHHPPLAPLKFQEKTLLGYISGGEAEDYRPYFKQLKQKGLLLKPNIDWKGHYIVDIRQPEWAQLVIERLIPAIVQQGFNGIMIDTLDSPIALEAKDPKRYAGMQQAAVNLVKSIRYHYPSLRIMVNRGFEILPAIETDIDYLLAESVYVSYDGKTEAFIPFPPAIYKYHVDLFKAAQQRQPQLKIVTLDYWNMKDEKGVASIYATQRTNGFIPYVSSLELQDIFPEPAP